MFGKNVLSYGLPFGYDGRNLTEFRNGYELNRDFLNVTMPWLQFYIAAASMSFFGLSAGGCRILFIMAGLAAVFVQFLFVRRYFHNDRLALINALLMASSVSFILFSRQCRYYSLVMLLLPSVMYMYAVYRRRLRETIYTAILFQTFFFANHLIAATSLTALAISLFIFDEKKKSLHFFLKPLWINAAITIPFLLWLYSNGSPAYSHVFRNIHPYDFLRILWLYFRDYNYTQLLPVGVLVVLIFFWIFNDYIKKRKSSSERRREISIFFFISLYTLLISILSPQSSDIKFSDIRYATAIFPCLLLIQAFLADVVFRWRRYIGISLLFVMISTNIFTFTKFRSFFYEYSLEITTPFDNSVKAAVEFIEERVKDGEIILVTPNYMNPPMQYYFGKRLLFCNIIGEDNKNLLKNGAILPEYVYSTKTIPHWIVRFGPYLYEPHTIRFTNSIDLSNYINHDLKIKGVDESRPELFIHAFKPSQKEIHLSQRLKVMERKGRE